MELRARHGGAAAGAPAAPPAAAADDEAKGKAYAAAAPAPPASASPAADALACVPSQPRGAWVWGDKVLPAAILLLCIYTRFWNIHLPSGIVFDVRGARAGGEGPPAT